MLVTNFILELIDKKRFFFNPLKCSSSYRELAEGLQTAINLHIGILRATKLERL